MWESDRNSEIGDAEERGKEERKKENQLEIAKKLLNIGMDVKEIAEITGVEVKEIEELIKGIK